MTSQTCKLSVVIPAYNGETNLNDGVLEKVAAYLQKQDYPYEVLVVNDGSTDRTAEIVAEKIKKWPQFRLINNPHKGKAVTVMTGLLQSRGEIALFTDLDQSTPLKEVEKFFPKFDRGFDVVIASRRGRAGSPIIRKLASLTFSVLRNVILQLPIADTQCGFKAFTHRAVEEIFPDMLKRWQDIRTTGRSVNAGFDVEFLYIAKKKHLKIAELGVAWEHVGTEKEQLVKDAVEAVQAMARIRFHDWQGRYG